MKNAYFVKRRAVSQNYLGQHLRQIGYLRVNHSQKYLCFHREEG